MPLKNQRGEICYSFLDNSSRIDLSIKRDTNKKLTSLKFIVSYIVQITNQK